MAECLDGCERRHDYQIFAGTSTRLPKSNFVNFCDEMKRSRTGKESKLVASTPKKGGQRKRKRQKNLGGASPLSSSPLASREAMSRSTATIRKTGSTAVGKKSARKGKEPVDTNSSTSTGEWWSDEDEREGASSAPMPATTSASRWKMRRPKPVLTEATVGRFVSVETPPHSATHLHSFPMVNVNARFPSPPRSSVSVSRTEEEVGSVASPRVATTPRGRLAMAGKRADVASMSVSQKIDWNTLASESAAYKSRVAARYQATHPGFRSVSAGHRAGNPQYGYGMHGKVADKPKSREEILEEGVDLVFKGGGAKGNVFIGAIQALMDREIKFRRVIGTSAGSFQAIMLALNVPPQELHDLILSKMVSNTGQLQPAMEAVMLDLPRPEDDSEEERQSSYLMSFLKAIQPPLIPQWLDSILQTTVVNAAFNHSMAVRVGHSLLEEGGAIVGNAVVEYLNNVMKEKFEDLKDFDEPTLIQLFDQTESDLTVVASNLTSKERLILNHRTAPHCPAAWAVRMSMALPMAYRFVEWREEWGHYMGKDITGSRVVDGGVTDVFALDLLLDSDPLVVKAMGREDEYQYKEEERPMIGFLIDDDLEVPDAPPPPHAKSAAADAIANFGPVTYLSSMLDTGMDAGYMTIQTSFPDLVCHLPAKSYGTLEMNMSEERLTALMAGGQHATEHFLDHVWPLTRKDVPSDKSSDKSSEKSSEKK